MATTYDDQKTGKDAFDEITKGYYDDEFKSLTDSAAKERASAVNGTSLANQEQMTGEKGKQPEAPKPYGLRQAEKNAAIEDRLGRGYTSGIGLKGKGRDGNTSEALDMLGAMKKGLKGTSLRQKWAIFGSVGGVLAALTTGGLGGFSFFGVFQLDHLMSNIELKGFVRFQVDMEGRSNKWIAAYMALRLGEIEDPNLRPADRDNIIFRANKVGGNLKLASWYKVLRGSTFENDMLERQGIRFASSAIRGPDGVVRFRPAVVRVQDRDIVMENLSEGEQDAIRRGDVNGFNGRLRQFVDVDVLQNDREARVAIRHAVRAQTRPWQVLKRYYMRKAIQNMTGVRDWRLFENRTITNPDGTTSEVARRDLRQERIARIRNKIITKAFPESTRSGKFIQCIFGITECRNTTDPSDPENRSNINPPDPQTCRDNPQNPACSTGHTDADGNPVANNGDAADAVNGGLVDDAADTTGSLTRKFLAKIMDKVNVATGIISFIDTINTINNNMKKGTLSALVYMGRATQAIGIYTVMGIARDQMRNGELSGQEADDAMMVLAQAAGNSEGWRNVVTPGDRGLVSAAGMEPAKDKESYCQADHQEEMLKTENEEAAKKEFHWLCPFEKIGGDNLASDIENGWNASIGFILNPILKVYNDSGLANVVSFINGAMDKILGPIIKQVTSKVLTTLGLDDDLKSLTGWVIAKAAQILGAGPAMSELAPPGVWANHALMGAAASSESMARFAGAAASTATTKGETSARVVAYQQEEAANMSLADKYWSLSSPTSVASKGLFNILDQGVGPTMMATLASIFNLPASILSGTQASAAEVAANSSYAAANFGGLLTYDYPSQCINRDPLVATTAQDDTNADELGLIKAEDLTKELVSNSEQFYNKLYETDDLKATAKVYNCELLDEMVRGSTGGLYDESLLGQNAYGVGYDNTTGGAEGAAGEIPTGTTQELAQKILDSPNIDFQRMPIQEDYFTHIAKTGHAQQCGAPAVSPILLGVILALSQKYKLTVGVFVDGHACNNGFHPKGMAVDFNGVDPLTGTGGTGPKIEWTAAEQTILKQFYVDAAATVVKAGGGHINQYECFSAVAAPERPKGVETATGDSCDHVHLDVGK